MRALHLSLALLSTLAFFTQPGVGAPKPEALIKSMTAALQEAETLQVEYSMGMHI